MKVTDEMVSRFLNWKLPDDFAPDAGITFKRVYNETSSYGPRNHEPVGTNLLTAAQARAMLEYVLAAPETAPEGFAHLSRTDLRALVDHVWNCAKESEEVPGTPEADKMIDHALGDDVIVPAPETAPEPLAIAVIVRDAMAGYRQGLKDDSPMPLVSFAFGYGWTYGAEERSRRAPETAPVEAGR